MTQRATRLALWIAALLLVPLPMLQFGAQVPVAQYLLLAGVCAAVAAVESSSGVLLLLLSLFLTHALVYALLLWFAAGLVARLLARLAPRARTAAVATAVLAGLGVALLGEPYVTPFDRAPRGNLATVLGVGRAAEGPTRKDEAPGPPAQREAQACADRDPLRRPYFGDLHVHTALSFDAAGQGTRATPRDAYRFAQGAPLGIPPFDASGRAGQTIRLRRPLDFAAVTDHAELLGETRICDDPAQPGHGSLICRVVRRWPRLGYVLVNARVFSQLEPERYGFCGEDGAGCRAAAAGPWREIQDAAAEAQDTSDACRFTSFVAYEWSGMPGGDNIHRNVIFRNARAQELPTSYIETPTAEGLWDALERECLSLQSDCDALAIPHNSNVSGGLIWPTAHPDGTPIARDDAVRRASLEPLVEITQHKGDSECRANESDELCGYEKLPWAR
ncbi:MAG TPA: DUF3604 domain-containing protein, partial [Myxococcota bacterium]|nr:DUF3604 domain-containing protein [Myxococcota bacterium]